MFCPNCGKQLEDSVAFCPECGTKVATAEPAPQPVTEPVAEPVAEPAPQPAPAFAPQQPAFSVAAPVAAQKKKKKGLKIALAILIPVLVIALAAVLCLTVFSNFFAKNFSSPEKYYEHVEKENVEELSAELASLYDDLFLVGSKAGVETEVKLQLSPNALSILQSSAGEDFSWLKDISISLDAGKVGSLMQSTLGLTHGGSPVAGVDVIYDNENNNVLFGLPGITDSYLSVNPEQLLSEAGAPASLNSLSVNDLPSEEEVERIINKYLNIVVSNFDKVTKTSETLTVGEVSQKCTVLTVEIDEQTAFDIVVDVLTEVKGDKQIKDIVLPFISAMYGSYEVSADELYASLLTEIDYILEDIELPDFGGQNFILKNYVDSDGDIVARSFERGMDTYAFIGEAVSGKNFAAEISAPSLLITGNGTIKGGKRNGSYTVSTESVVLATIQAENFEYEIGEIEGKLTITPDYSILEMADMDASVVGMFSPSVTLNFKDDSVDVELIASGSPMVTLSLSAKESKPKKITMPTNVQQITSVDEIEGWFENIDIDAISAKLAAAGIPEDLLTGLFYRSESVTEYPAYSDEYYDDYYDDYYDYDDGYADYSENVDGY